MLACKSLIIVGDTNLTMNAGEIWGLLARGDPLQSWFFNFFLGHGLIDVLPKPVAPTWNNGCKGADFIAKRIDRFLVSESLFQAVDKCSSCISPIGVSDHEPILLRLQIGIPLYRFPFKYYHVWSIESAFISLVRDHWAFFWSTPHGRTMEALPTFLRSLKALVLPWLRIGAIIQKADLLIIEEKIRDYHFDPIFGMLNDLGGIIIHSLEKDLVAILRTEEEIIRLKSRALWISAGDHNSIFFHNYVNMRRKINTIWEIIEQNGCGVSSQPDLERAARDHFEKLYTKLNNLNLRAQMEVLQCMPCFFTDDDNEHIGRPVALDEVAIVLKKMAKDKSLGPDGWTVEFYTQFFDLLGNELVSLVEEARTTGRVNGGLNLTFISLIPKVSEPSSFQDYRPISLCNLLYKIISKVIVDHIRDGLSRGISSEQFGFLKQRLIFDAIGTAQETIHYAQTSFGSSLVFKIDLVKAYDLVDWSFLRLLLLNAGLNLGISNWILGCITSVNFAVLVNRQPSSFFKASRGLRQGCPLLPLVFLMVIKGLSRLILLAKAQGSITGIKTSRHFFITHLLFVDDVLIFGAGTLEEWSQYKTILDLFCLATSMSISISKSCFYYFQLNAGTCDLI